MLLPYDLITFQILGQKSVKFLENLEFQKDILKLTDLYDWLKVEQLYVVVV